MYTGFAEVYDQLMADVDYEGWAGFYAEMMKSFGVSTGSKACECACGTGSLTIPLNRAGYQMTGVDLSQEMLWIAAQRARKQGMGIPFVKQDMRELRLHRTMDAVLATCDGVNYLLTDQDALKFFTAAFQALRPGGGLFFDVSTPHKLKTKLGNQLLCEDTEDVTYVWQNEFHDKTGLIDMQLCFFVKEQDGRYRRIDEEQRQKAHEMQTLSSLLYQAGFGRVYAYGDRVQRSAKPTDQRWHFAAIKPEAAEE